MTLLPDGRLQTQPVWFNYDPPYVLMNVMRGFRKERNMTPVSPSWSLTPPIRAAGWKCGG
jgi:hypothetical protein